METLEACSLSEAGGKKTLPFSLSISNPDSNATIWYTLDGSSPVAGGSLKYSSVLSVGHSCTVKAIASKSGMNNSPEASATYHFLWTNRASLATARYGACAAAIGAKVYVMGGKDTTVSKEAWVLDTTTDSWSADDDMPQALYRACALAYGGQIYVFGGHDGSSARADIYRFNPSASVGSRWSKPSIVLGTARFWASVALVGSRAYIVGGDHGSGNLASTEVVDLSAMTVNSTAVDALETAVQQHTALAVGNCIYVFGGDAGSPDVLKLDPSASPFPQWTTLTGPVLESFDMAAGGVVDGKAYTIGGYWTAPPYTANSCRSFDPAGPSAAYGTPMPTARYEAANAVVNGTIVVIGGITSPGSTPTLTDLVEQYDPAAE